MENRALVNRFGGKLDIQSLKFVAEEIVYSILVQIPCAMRGFASGVKIPNSPILYYYIEV